MRCLIAVILFASFTIAKAQVFQSKTTLYASSNAKTLWYTGNEYSSVATYNGNVYFVMLDSNLCPLIGKIVDGITTIEILEKDYPSYTAFDNGHHEFSIGVDRDGFVHVTGDMHNFPNTAMSSTLPISYQSANILYWKSKNPEDITDFDFIGLNSNETIPGESWTYGRFVTDRNHKMYYISRTLARQYYSQNGGRALGLYSYEETTKSWTAYGEKAPISDASYPVVCWEESGVNGGSYQSYKGDICFDENNRMYITTAMNTQNGAAGINSVIFAYSDDGGRTFYKMNGDLIGLPMQIAAGARQGDVVDIAPDSAFNQASVTHAFDNKPVIQYTVNGNGYYKYWTGTGWSNRVFSPVQAIRGRLLYNEFEEMLYFISIMSGKVFAKTSFTSGTSFYDVGDTFRAFDPQMFRDENILTGVSWKASTGDFEVFQLYGNQILANSEPVQTDESLILYPNPTKDLVYITSNDIIENVKVTDLQGKLIDEYSNNSVKFAIDLSNREAGVYHLTINDASVYRILKY